MVGKVNGSSLFGPTMVFPSFMASVYILRRRKIVPYGFLMLKGWSMVKSAPAILSCSTT